MTVDSIEMQPLPAEFEDLKQQQVQEKVEETHCEKQEKWNSDYTGCCVFFVLSMLLLAGILAALFMMLPFFLNTRPSNIGAVEFPLNYNENENLAGEIDANYIFFTAYDIAGASGIREDSTPSFFACSHDVLISESIVGCVTQGYIPTFDECKKAYEKYEEDGDQSHVLSGARTVPVCGVKELYVGEFALCDSEEPVFISLYNSDPDNTHAFDISLAYGDCNECMTDIEEECEASQMMWCNIISAIILLNIGLGCCLACAMYFACRRKRSTVIDPDYDIVPQEE